MVRCQLTEGSPSYVLARLLSLIPIPFCFVGKVLGQYQRSINFSKTYEMPFFMSIQKPVPVSLEQS
jgi:hypothetical protein